jgi:hypothetical protein
MNIKINLNQDKIVGKVKNDHMGLFVSQNWKRLIDPYTPRDTATMQNTARLYPFNIHYIQKYSSKVYHGKDLNFQKKNPYSTYEWDLAAARAGQLNKLYRTINNGLRSGRI